VVRLVRRQVLVNTEQGARHRHNTAGQHSFMQDDVMLINVKSFSKEDLR